MSPAPPSAAGSCRRSSVNLVVLSRLWERSAFARLIELYEENYRLCVEILGVDDQDANDWYLIADPKLPTLAVTFLNQAPYTRTLEMQFVRGGPELVVSCRLYMDLKVCDALFFMDRKQGGGIPEEKVRGLQGQWAHSLRFQKWLYYLKDQGYARKLP